MKNSPRVPTQAHVSADFVALRNELCTFLHISITSALMRALCRFLAVLAVTDPVKEEAAGVIAAIEVNTASDSGVPVRANVQLLNCFRCVWVQNLG
jgi:hypothetical protein